MSAITDEERKEFQEALASFNSNAEALLEVPVSRLNSPDQKVYVGSQGERVAVWLLIAASALILGMNIGQRDTITQQAAQINEMQRKYDRLQDYLNAIYAQAPQLKPKE